MGHDRVRHEGASHEGQAEEPLPRWHDDSANDSSSPSDSTIAGDPTLSSPTRLIAGLFSSKRAVG